jgi:hypothetical protein
VTANLYANTLSVLLNEVPVATLLERFEGRWTGDAIEVRWQFAASAGVRSANLERGASAAGPWTPVAGELRTEGASTILVDAAVSAGSEYFYRLGATMSDGGFVTFGPVNVTAGRTAGDLPPLALTPNPSQQEVSIDFALAREEPVRLSVIDVRGRRIVTLADGVYAAGHHQVIWNGVGRSARVPAGLYFVDCETAEKQSVRKLVLTR